MYRVLLLQICFLFVAFAANAQRPEGTKKDTTTAQAPTDTVKPYINVGKIAGRRAAIRSAMLPGLGQIRNGVTVYRLAKVGGIYTGFTLLTLSYIDNSNQFKVFNDEIKFRANNGGKSDPRSVYASYPTSGLISARDVYKRNRQVIIFSYVGLYLLNIIEAYVDARLANFDVGDVTSFKISPTAIPPGQMYGFSGVAPGVKLTLSF